jgi:hypothetical protein
VYPVHPALGGPADAEVLIDVAHGLIERKEVSLGLVDEVGGEDDVVVGQLAAIGLAEQLDLLVEARIDFDDGQDVFLVGVAVQGAGLVDEEVEVLPEILQHAGPF